MSELYDRAAKLDRGVADRWKARSGDKPDYKLKPDDIDAMMGPLVGRGKTMTESQANAVALLVQGTRIDRKDVPLIRARLRNFMHKAEDAGSLDLKPLITADELAPVLSALTTPSIGLINFKSPKTGLTYSAFDYAAVRKFVESKTILVAEALIGGLSPVAKQDGEYNSDQNVLIVYSGLSPTDRIVTVVHESTHVIQDFRDAKGISTHFEADAFIAEAVVISSLVGQQEFDDAIKEAAFAAAQLVIDRKASGSDKGWTDAYQAVLDAVNKSPVYRAKARLWVDKGNADTTSELAMLNKTIDDLKKAHEALVDWAKDALDVTLLAPVKRIGEVIP